MVGHRHLHKIKNPLRWIFLFIFVSMSKHLNKEWLREKEYRSLRKELDYLREILPRYNSYRYIDNSRHREIRNKLNSKFYNYDRIGDTPPKWYRKMLNSRQKTKIKKELYKTIQNIDYDSSYVDNYKDARWRFW